MTTQSVWKLNCGVSVGGQTILGIKHLDELARAVDAIVVGDEDQTYIDNSVPIFPYSNVGEPNTMFNPVPIKAAHRISAHKPTKKGARERAR